MKVEEKDLKLSKLTISNRGIYKDLTMKVRESVSSGVLSRSTHSIDFDCFCVEATINKVQKELVGMKLEGNSLRPVGVHPRLAALGVRISDGLLRDKYLIPLAGHLDLEVNKLRGELLSEYAVVQLGSANCDFCEQEVDLIVYVSMMSALLDRGFLGLNDSDYIDKSCKELIQYNYELKKMLFSNNIFYKNQSVIKIISKIRGKFPEVNNFMKTKELKVIDKLTYHSMTFNSFFLPSNYHIISSNRLLEQLSGEIIEEEIRNNYSKLCVYKAFISNVVKAIASREKKTAGSQFILEKK